MRRQRSEGFFLCLVAVGTLFLGLAVPGAAQTSAPAQGWEFELTGFAWFSGLTGTIGVGESSQHVSTSFSDISKKVASHFAADFEGRDGKWGFVLFPYYVLLKDSEPTPYGFNVDVSAKTIMVGAQGLYQAYENKDVRLEVLFGARYNDMVDDINAPGSGYPPYHAEYTWLDPLVGFDARYRLGSAWLLGLRGDIGGFGVGSKLTWDVIAAIDWRVSKLISLKAAYGVLSTDYETGSGDSRFVYDVRQEGPVLGVTFHF